MIEYTDRELRHELTSYCLNHEDPAFVEVLSTFDDNDWIWLFNEAKGSFLKAVLIIKNDVVYYHDQVKNFCIG